MKKTLRITGLFAALCLLMPAFTSCDKDDDDDDVVAVPSEVTRTWVGTLAAKVMNIDCDMPGMYEVSILKEPTEDDEVQVVIPETSFKYPGSERVSTIPSFTIPEVDVEKSGNGYTISKDKYSVTLNGVTYSGSIQGKIGASAEISYNVKPG
ncbi:MAG: hypothetical protein K2K93_10940, partial [Muribaculaceae bacterium]|nr:hypothetical protein [Muribaculaceae bacterium]